MRAMGFSLNSSQITLLKLMEVRLQNECCRADGFQDGLTSARTTYANFESHYELRPTLIRIGEAMNGGWCVGWLSCATGAPNSLSNGLIVAGVLMSRQQSAPLCSPA